MKPENLVETLRERIREFGEKPAYILSSEELDIGVEHEILDPQKPNDCGDGTVTIKALFEGKTFVCIKEKD